MSDSRGLGGGCCGGARLGRLGREVTVTDALTPQTVTYRHLVTQSQGYITRAWSGLGA